MELFSTIPFYWTFENGRLDIFLALEVTYKEIIIIVFFLNLSYSLCYLTFSGVKNALIIPNIKLPGFLTLFTLACSSMSVSETCQFFQQLCLNCPSCVNPQRNVALVFNKQLIQRDIKTDVDMFIKYCSIALEVQLLRGKEWIPVIKVFIYRTFWTSSLRMGKKKKNRVHWE